MQKSQFYGRLLTVLLMKGFVIELLGASGQVESRWYIREAVDQWSGILAQCMEESSSDYKDGQRQHNLSQQSVIASTRQ